MRCIMVNGAKLKAETLCARCGGQIGDGYVREIGSRLIYCDFHCYSTAAETSFPMRDPRQPTINAWTRTS